MNASFRLNMHNPYWDYGTVFPKRFIGDPGDTLRAEGTEFYLNGNIWEVSSLTGQVAYKANPFMLARLGIEKVPSLITQEGRKPRVEEMVLK